MNSIEKFEYLINLGQLDSLNYRRKENVPVSLISTVEQVEDLVYLVNSSHRSVCKVINSHEIDKILRGDSIGIYNLPLSTSKKNPDRYIKFKYSEVIPTRYDLRIYENKTWRDLDNEYKREIHSSFRFR